MPFLDPPDYVQLAHQLELAVAHLKLLANTPNNQQGDLTMKALEDISSRLGNIEKGLKDVQTEAAETKAEADARYKNVVQMIAADHNASARAHNHNVPEYGVLHVLRDYRTNLAIPGFPVTPEAIEDLSDTELTAFLEALGFTCDGNENDKIEMFIEKIGLPS